MTEATTRPPTPRDSAEKAVLREMGHDLGIALYHRFSAAEAAEHLGIPIDELDVLRDQGRIAHLQIGGKRISFFGIHLLTYLRECIIPVGAHPRPPPAPEPPPEPRPEKPTINPDAELVSVKEATTLLGIGRTKLYELINSREIESVKIGTRTLIRQASLRRLIGREAEAGGN